MTVRAFFEAVQVAGVAPPYENIHLKIFYPAKLSGNELERSQGIVPPDTTRAPFPLLVFFPGVNCTPQMYTGLLKAIAERGVVVVLPTWIAQNVPGRTSLTPGIDLKAANPTHYGKQPTSSSLSAILDKLKHLHENNIIRDLLDHDRVILGGHSAGGTMALQNADLRLFPQIKAAFAYCANPLAVSVLAGFDKGVLPPLPSDVPTLLFGATEDGIGTRHNDHLGRPGRSGADTVRATFDEALKGTGKYVVILQGANHHTIGDPLDETVGRTYLDSPATEDESALRDLIADIIGRFIDAHVFEISGATHKLMATIDPAHRLIAHAQSK